MIDVKAVPWILAALFAVLFGTVTALWLEKRTEFDSLQASYDQRDRDYDAAARAKDQQYHDNLNVVKERYEKSLATAGDTALRNFCLRNPAMCRPAPACSAARDAGDDGAGRERVPVVADPANIGAGCEEVIRNAALDVLKIRAWIEYCTRNNCPIAD